jgi:GNAT superfamily N-acetyltransferase
MAIIVRAGLNDLPQLARLYEELSGKKTDMVKMKTQFERMQDNGDYVVLCASVNGGITGSLMGIVCRDIVGDCRSFMVIENVIVAGEYRRQGIGRLLIDEIERTARELKCYYTMFVSDFKRKDAHKFYNSAGYKLDQVQGFKKYLDKEKD